MNRQRLLALVVLALALASPLSAGRATATDRPSAAELEGELVCVTCKTTLDESDSPIARRMKAYIRRRIAEGATATQIKDELVAQFGQEVLATPRTHGFDLLAWALPIGGIGAGALALGGLAWAWTRRRDDRGEIGPRDPAAPLDAELERRLDEELARFEE
jgi:cytochrome c-type biogenesis protein CcmH